MGCCVCEREGERGGGLGVCCVWMYEWGSPKRRGWWETRGSEKRQASSLSDEMDNHPNSYQEYTVVRARILLVLRYSTLFDLSLIFFSCFFLPVQFSVRGPMRENTDHEAKPIRGPEN